mmetsp:Transcript_41546/g.90516  ORF Transcript_41546/g.90516 Transcript_41546/m.90516 type:complete len:360 (-) Transcript_41546:251-1330(-)
MVVQGSVGPGDVGQSLGVQIRGLPNDNISSLLEEVVVRMLCRGESPQKVGHFLWLEVAQQWPSSTGDLGSEVSRGLPQGGVSPHHVSQVLGVKLAQHRLRLPLQATQEVHGPEPQGGAGPSGVGDGLRGELLAVEAADDLSRQRLQQRLLASNCDTHRSQSPHAVGEPLSIEVAVLRLHQHQQRAPVRIGLHTLRIPGLPLGPLGHPVQGGRKVHLIEIVGVSADEVEDAESGILSADLLVELPVKLGIGGPPTFPGRSAALILSRLPGRTRGLVGLRRLHHRWQRLLQLRLLLAGDAPRLCLRRTRAVEVEKQRPCDEGSHQQGLPQETAHLHGKSRISAVRRSGGPGLHHLAAAHHK